MQVAYQKIVTSRLRCELGAAVEELVAVLGWPPAVRVGKCKGFNTETISLWCAWLLRTENTAGKQPKNTNSIHFRGDVTRLHEALYAAHIIFACFPLMRRTLRKKKMHTTENKKNQALCQTLNQSPLAISGREKKE